MTSDLFKLRIGDRIIIERTYAGPTYGYGGFDIKLVREKDGQQHRCFRTLSNYELRRSDPEQLFLYTISDIIRKINTDLGACTRVAFADVGLTKAEAFLRLFNNARLKDGVPFTNYDSKIMKLDEAQKVLEKAEKSPQGLFFDLYEDRVLLVDFTGDTLDFAQYDRNNGPEAGFRALTSPNSAP